MTRSLYLILQLDDAYKELTYTTRAFTRRLLCVLPAMHDHPLEETAAQRHLLAIPRHLCFHVSRRDCRTSLMCRPRSHTDDDDLWLSDLWTYASSETTTVLIGPHKRYSTGIPRIQCLRHKGRNTSGPHPILRKVGFSRLTRQ